MLKPRPTGVNWNNPLTRGLVLSLPFTEGGGTRTQDLATRITGTVQQGVTWTTGASDGLWGVGAKYSSVNGSISLGNNSKMMQAIFSWSFLVYLATTHTSGSGAKFLIKKDTPYIFDFNGNGLFEFAVHNGSGYDALFSTKGTWAPGYYHIVLTCNASARRIYVNGVLDKSGGGVSTSNNTSSTVYLGAQDTGGTSAFDGSIIQVNEWSRVLNQDEAKSLNNDPWQIYNRPLPYQPLNSLTNGGWSSSLMMMGVGM